MYSPEAVTPESQFPTWSEVPPAGGNSWAQGGAPRGELDAGLVLSSSPPPPPP